MLLTGGPLGTLPQMEKARAAAGRATVRRAACLAPAVFTVVDSMMAVCGGVRRLERRGWWKGKMRWNEVEGGFGAGEVQ